MLVSQPPAKIRQALSELAPALSCQALVPAQENMADDDLDILQQLLELADEDEKEAVSPVKQTPHPAEGHTDPSSQDCDQNENVPPNKRPRMIPAKTAAEGKYS